MKLHLLCGILAAAAAFGCQDTVNTVEHADKAMHPTVIRDARFVTDRFLRDRLALQSLSISETADGFMRVQLEVMNDRTGVWSQAWSGMTGENPYDIRYKFDWFDSNGMAVNSVLSDWQDATIIPGETLYLQSVAPTRDCRDFKVSLKESEKED